MTDLSSKRRARRAAAPSEAPKRNIAESPLAWLAQHKDKSGQPLLSDAEFDAGEKLRADFWFAQMTPRVTANWSLLLGASDRTRSSPDIGPDIRDAVIAAQERVHRALAAVGAELANVLIDVCCHLKGLEQSEKESGLPQRSAKILLRIGLNQLARHYGMIQPAIASRSPPVRVRHWGKPDYKPSGDREPQ